MSALSAGSRRGAGAAMFAAMALLMTAPGAAGQQPTAHASQDGADCTADATLVVSCDAASTPPGVCLQTVFPGCGRSVLARSSCGRGGRRGPITCSSTGPATIACGGLGLTLPACAASQQNVPGLCAAEAGQPAPPCASEMDPLTICGSAEPASPAPCNFTVAVRSQSLRQPRRPRRASRLRPRLDLTLGCPAALAGPGGTCTGVVAVESLRSNLLLALRNQAQGDAGVYEHFTSAGTGAARNYLERALRAAARHLGGTKLPARVTASSVVTQLGRSDPLARSYAAALRRAVDVYRTVTLQGARARGARPSNPSDVRPRASTTQRFSLPSGSSAAPVRFRLSRETGQVLVRDAGSRRRVPARVIVAFDAEPQPVVKFIDIPVSISRR